MATYSVLSQAGAGITSGTFFQPGATFRSSTTTSYNRDNPTGTIVAITGTGFVFDGANLPTAGTVTSITLYAADFATQLVGIAGLSFALVDLHARWLGPTPGNVFAQLLAGADTVEGTSGDDTLQSYAGADTIEGFAGFDYIDPGRGADTIDGGDGLDTLSYSAANNDGAIIKGVTFDLTKATVTDPWGDIDTIISIERARGTRFGDVFIGNSADNRFEGLGGSDIYTGGDGIDRVSFQRDAQFNGTKGVTVNLAAGTATDGFGNDETFTGIEQATGTDQADTIIGGDSASGVLSYDVFALGGDDIITAGKHDFYAEPGAGNDTITAGTGFDQVSYSDSTTNIGATINLATGTVADPFGGTDTLVGDFEAAHGTRHGDTFIGNALNNRFVGLAGNDTLNGGDGTDRARYDRDAQFGGTAAVTVNLATGLAVDGFGDFDTLVSIEAVQGTAQGDTMVSGTADLAPGQSYELYGRGGNDTLFGSEQPTYYEPGAGDDTITGGTSQSDLLSYSDYTGGLGVTIDLASGTVADPFGGTDTFTGIENLRGTQNADTLTGDAGANQFNGLGGADIIDGGDGIDMMRYDRDERFAGGTAGVLADLAAGTGRDGFGSIDTLVRIEQLRGSNALTGNSISLDGGKNFTDFADALYGNDDDNLFQGLNGNDLLDGRGGRDTADYSRDRAEGGTAGVTVNLAAGTATDGFGKADRLVSIENAIGTASADRLTGDGADNVLTGGLGNDILDGAGGTDTAVFSEARESYRIGITGKWIGVSGPDGTDYAKDVELLQFGASAPITAESLRGQPETHELMSFITSGELIFALPLDYSGPLDLKYVYPGTNNDDVVEGTSFNDFMNLAGGNDAAQMGGGDDTVDGGGGNNFLTGGAGRDTFFLDGRFLVPVWSCITDWEVGEALTLWGWTAGVSTAAWSESDGLPGYLGATMFADIDGNGLVETAITWTGKSRADLPVGQEITVSGIGVLYIA